LIEWASGGHASTIAPALLLFRSNLKLFRGDSSIFK